ncbi:hypothetical protein BDF20DRAFT_370868 [Mycotypha africana]|uniref:uncharacterized protein n=1 Tax=Mycotypha africana TaxID=64632 RepID=UPI002301822D|nr:uncharacterized protein BDF20DRAFT_370868 [Mycotypha africana]KAI8984191.1 hypothetical protein BDF20DRAFT_370868 [Mycotypha africana]
MEQQQLPELNQVNSLPDGFFPMPLASPTATKVNFVNDSTAPATERTTTDPLSPKAQRLKQQQNQELEHQQYRNRVYQRRSSRSRGDRVIVIAYDHSNYSDAMIAKAIKLNMIRPTDDIRIVHIVSQNDYRTLFAPMLATSVSTTSGVLQSEMDTNMSHAVNVMMYELTHTLGKHGFFNVSSDVLRGDPKASIADYCRITKPLYLITGTRGLGAVKRSVMGSVSSYLIRHCPCPVLVCKVEPSEIEARKEQNRQKQATFEEVLSAVGNSTPQTNPR